MRNPVELALWFARGLRRRLQDWWRGETDETLFDIHDLRRLNEHLVSLGVAPFHNQLAQAATDEAGAIRYILATLASSPKLRARFPDALTQRDNFHEWLLQQHGLSETARTNIRAAFAGYRGERIKRIHELREDLREVHFPLALTPHPDRIGYLHWLIVHGTTTYGITIEEGLWELFELNELPDRGLVKSYLSNPFWQEAVPHGLTVFGWTALKQFLRTKHGAGGRWLDAAQLPRQYCPWDELSLYRRVLEDGKQSFPIGAACSGDADAVQSWVRATPNGPALSEQWYQELRVNVTDGLPNTPGANIMGHFRYPSGLQEAAIGVDRALKTSGGRTTLRDMPVLYEYNWQEPEAYRGVELFDHTVYIAAVNSTPKLWLKKSGIHWRKGVRRIAIWYWELEELPQDWVDELGWPDEVWAPTRFIAETFRKYVMVPVVPMLPGVELPIFASKTRSYFKLPDDRFLFLVTFDMGSVMMRKNPLAVIAAFQQAFRNGEPVHLVIKVSRGESRPADFAKLQVATTHPNITLINQVFSRDDTLALLQTADAYVSLHRSEGLGLGMAESMLMGKPVVATNYSGNTDFMTPETSYLVDYHRVEIVDDIFPYPKGCLWAEPSVTHATELLRQIFKNQTEAKAVGQRGKRHVEEVLSMAAYGQRIAARLRDVSELR